MQLLKECEAVGSRIMVSVCSRKHLWQTTGLCNRIYVYVKSLYNSFSHCADEHDTTNMPWQHVSANNPSVSVMRRAGRKGKRLPGKKKRG